MVEPASPPNPYPSSRRMLGRFAPGIRRADGPGQVTGDGNKIINQPPIMKIHTSHLISLLAIAALLSFGCSTTQSQKYKKETIIDTTFAIGGDNKVAQVFCFAIGTGTCARYTVEATHPIRLDVTGYRGEYIDRYVCQSKNGIITAQHVTPMAVKMAFLASERAEVRLVVEEQKQ